MNAIINLGAGLFFWILVLFGWVGVETLLDDTPAKLTYAQLVEKDCHRQYQWWDYESGTCQHFTDGYGGDGRNYTNARNPLDSK